LETDGNSPTLCASFWGFFRMAKTGEFLISSLEYSTSAGTKHNGKGKHFACSMRFMLSRRHRMRARRLLAGSFFIFFKKMRSTFEVKLKYASDYFYGDGRSLMANEELGNQAQQTTEVKRVQTLT